MIEETAQHNDVAVSNVITAGNLLVHEFIGLNAEIIRCTDAKQQGAKGTIIDETKNTIVIETREGEKKFVKKNCVFRFSLPSGGTADVEGELIALDPAERPKKLAKHCRI